MLFSDKFVTFSKEYCTFEKHINAPYFRGSFLSTEKNGAYSFTICGLGFYELFINGSCVTKGRLAPYISNPDHILYYDFYDLSEYVLEGENVIGIILGNGFLNAVGGEVWDFDKAEFRSAPKFAAALEYKGKLISEADGFFKTNPSPITFDDLRAGEHYDARQETPNWNLPGFCDENWADAISATRQKGVAKTALCEPIKKTDEINPVFFWKVKDGYIYDFGVNFTGVCRLYLENPESGQEIVMTHGEMLIDGELSIENICNDTRTRQGYMQTNRYIAKGEKTETYVPHFTYHGFRYVYVTGISGAQANKRLLTFLIMHSDLRTKGGFSCSDFILNKIQENTRRSILSNFFYFPTDCPQREKNGWTGDAAVSAEHILLNFSAENSFREWLNNIRMAQLGDGSLPGIVPTAGWGYEWGNGPAWDNALIQLTYYTYKYSGCLEVLIENEAAILLYLKYLSSKKNEEGLLAFGLGDWCQPNRRSWDYTTRLEITDSLTAMGICYKAGKIFKVCENSEAETYANKLYLELKDAFRKKYVLKNGRLRKKYATQTAVSMAIYHRAVGENESKNTFAQLKELIFSNGERFDTGILGARVLFRVLAIGGEAELACRLIRGPGFPSYGEHVLRGATTLFEDFQVLKEDSFEPIDRPKANSLNHHFFGDVSAWFIRYITGININPHFDNPNNAVIRPYFVGGLDRAEGFYEMPCGKLSVRWERGANGICVTVDVPEGAEAKLFCEGEEMALHSGQNSLII